LRVDFLSCGGQQVRGEPLLRVLEQLVLFAANVTAQEIAKAFQLLHRRHRPHLFHHTFERPVITDQLRNDRHVAQFALDQGK